MFVWGSIFFSPPKTICSLNPSIKKVDRKKRSSLGSFNKYPSQNPSIWGLKKCASEVIQEGSCVFPGRTHSVCKQICACSCDPGLPRNSVLQSLPPFLSDSPPPIPHALTARLQSVTGWPPLLLEVRAAIF